MMHWNYLDLTPPVILSCKLQGDNAYETVSRLKIIMNQIKNTMNDFSQLSVDAAALSRLLYKTKHKHRQDKGFKSMQKINRCLTNYITMHLPFTFRSIQNTLHAESGPSRQMLEWTLIRLFGIAHLFHRIYSLCEEAAGHLLIKIKLEHFFEISFFSLAIISRIWTFSQFIVRRACEWYRNLYQFLDNLEAAPIPWLPEDCVLQDDIIQTLDNPPYLQLKSVSSKPNVLASQLAGLISKNPQLSRNNEISGVFNIDLLDDIGESIASDLLTDEVIVENNDLCTERKQTTKRKNKNKKQKPEINHISYQHTIKNIKSSQDLSRFLEIENTLRSKTNKSKANISHLALMGKVNKLQWSLIQKCIKKQIKMIRKAEESSDVKKKKRLLYEIQENITKWIYFVCFLLIKGVFTFGFFLIPRLFHGVFVWIT